MVAGDTFGDIVGAVALTAVGLVLVPSFTRGLRTGAFGPIGPLPGMPATRAGTPRFYRVWLANSGLFPLACFAMALSAITAAFGVNSAISAVIIVVSFGLFGCALFAAAAVYFCYAVYGFRTGKSMALNAVTAKSSVFDRVQQPVLYWMYQILNTVLVVVLCAFGAGAIGVAVWLTVFLA